MKKLNNYCNKNKKNIIEYNIKLNILFNKKGDFNFFLFLCSLVLLVLAISYSLYSNNQSRVEVDFYDDFQNDISEIPSKMKKVYIENFFLYRELVNKVDTYANSTFHETIKDCDEKLFNLCVIDSLDIDKYKTNIETQKRNLLIGNSIFLEGKNLFYLEDKDSVSIIPQN